MTKEFCLRPSQDPVTHISIRKDASLSEVSGAVHDTMRYGWRNVQTGSQMAHPIQSIQNCWEETEDRCRYSIAKQVFGTHMPFRLQMEKAIVMQVSLTYSPLDTI
jgi:proteasome maturation protein